MELSVIKAIDEVNLTELERLLKINDLLHKGMPEYEGYKQSDMLTDMKYEEAVNFLKEQKLLEITLSNKEQTDYSPVQKINKNTLMFMDGIQIVCSIPEIKHVILMPKFDGCSVGCEIVKTSNGYEITKAHTRGTDNLNGTRKCQDKTDYIKTVSKDIIKNINDILTDKTIDLNIKIHYKNTDLVGNENKPNKTNIDLHQLDYLLIRGEFVSNNKDNINNDKLPSTAVGLAAGAINANEDKFNEYKDYINYIPFEIALLKINDGVNITEYIPTQESAIKIMRLLKMISYKTYKVDEINNSFNMENVLTLFEKSTPQPLDGVVYCNRYWTYPMIVEETSKRVNYGKYKWKRHNVKQTKLRNIEYSIGKTGKLTPSLIFDGVNINGKTYKQAKTTFNHIQDFIDSCKEKNVSFGNGLICEMELMSDISPQITRIFPTVSKIKEVIKPLEICPYCNKKLSTEIKTISKQRVINVSCVNPKCKGVLIQKCCDFLKQIGYKGISSKTLDNINYKHFADLYDAKLAKVYKDVGKKEKIIYSAKTIKNQQNKVDFDDIITTLNIKTFLISTSLFTKAKVSNFIKELELNEMDNFIENINTKKYVKLLDYLINKTDYFISDLVTFIVNHYVKKDN